MQFERRSGAPFPAKEKGRPKPSFFEQCVDGPKASDHSE